MTFDKEFCASLPTIAPSHTRVLPEWVILNPNWIAKLFVRLKSFSVRSKSKGFALVDDIKKAWKEAEVDPMLHDDLIDLLAHYKLAYLIRSDEKGKLVCLPSLFPQLQRPVVSKGEAVQTTMLGLVFVLTFCHFCR